MLFFPKKILTVGGDVIDPSDPGEYSMPTAGSYNFLYSDLPLACYPPSDPFTTNEPIFTKALIDIVIKQRNEFINNRTNTEDTEFLELLYETHHTLYPEKLVDRIWNKNIDNKTIRSELHEYLYKKQFSWLDKEGADPEARLLDDIFSPGNDCEKIWKKEIPGWLSGYLEDYPIIVVPHHKKISDPHYRSGSIRGRAGGNEYIGWLEYDSRLDERNKIRVLLEEILHLAQAKSTYWKDNRKPIEEAMTVFKKRISAHNEEGELDSLPSAKRPRQLLKRQVDIDHDSPFWKAKKWYQAEELFVDMAFVESQLLGGATYGKQLSQKKVDEIMADRFPEVYPHYKAFINECIEGAVKNLPKDIPAEEKQRLEEHWKASPFGEFAKQVYKPSDRKSR